MTQKPVTGVLPRRQPVTYSARPGFTPGSRPPPAPTRPHQPAGRPALDPHTPAAAPTPAPTPLDEHVHPRTDELLDDALSDEPMGHEQPDGDLADDDLADDEVPDDPDDLDDADLDLDRADLIEVLYPPSDDPFDVTLVLTAQQPDLHIALGTRLTPPLVADLLEQLMTLRDEQHQAMGLPPIDAIPTSSHEPPVEADDHDEEGLTRRAADPLGLRHLRQRSPKTTLYIAGAIAVLLALSLLINHLS